MVGIPRTLDALTLFVDDPKRSKGFYRSVFDLEPMYEDDDAVAFRLENFTLNLLARAAAAELVTPTAVGKAGEGAAFQLTIGVDDTDAVCEALATRGVALLNGPIDRPWGVRTAAFADPDGYVWEVAANIPKG
jgi:catechol 2,3-dioxygenase-like lactoylglutathione lyase family enzyme